jgi:predicted kinase
MTLLVVTGAPATGKSTIATRLATTLGWPLLAKDDLKEALFDVLGTGDRQWSRRLSDASFVVQFEAGRSFVDAGSSVVIEGNFRPEHSMRIQAIAARTGTDVVQVLCVASPDVAQERLRRRAGARHRGHLDVELETELEALLVAQARPLDLPGGRHVIDTSQLPLAQIDPLIARVVASLGR